MEKLKLARIIIAITVICLMCFSCGNTQNSKEEQKLKLEREEELRLEKGQDKFPEEKTGWKLEEERETQSKEHEKDDLDWLQGNWRYVSHMYGVTIDTRISINGNNIVVKYDGEVDYSGSYTIEGNHLVYYYDDGMSVSTPIDRVNHRLMVDDTHAFQRF